MPKVVLLTVRSVLPILALNLLMLRSSLPLQYPH